MYTVGQVYAFGSALQVVGYVCFALSKAARWFGEPVNSARGLLEPRMAADPKHSDPGAGLYWPVSYFFLAFSIAGTLAGTVLLIWSTALLAYAWLSGTHIANL